MRMGNVVDESNPDSGTDRPRWPYWVIGLALAGLVIAILVAAFILDARLRPPVGVQSAPTTVIGASIKPGPTVAVTVSGASKQAADATMTTAGTPNSSALDEPIRQAYLHYWDVYAEAMSTLDTSHLSEVAAGDRLQEAIAEVTDLKAQGRAAKIEVEHHLLIFNVTESTASVHDEYINNSYAIDPTSKSPLGTPGVGERLVDTYSLQKIDGSWKVIRGLRESSQ